MSKAKNRTKKHTPNSQKQKPVDDGYPFDTGDWEKWSSRKRLDWMINFRDKSRDLYKAKLNISDDDIAKMDADVEALEKVALYDEYMAAQQAARNAKPPSESVKMMGALIDDICANDYYKAKRLGLTDAQIDKMRVDTDKYSREVEDWERRQNAKKILGFAPPLRRTEPTSKKPEDDGTDDATKLRVLMAVKDIDDSALKAAFANGDEDAVQREWEIWIGKLQAKADEDPVFAKWFEEFRDDQEKLLRWDDEIDDEDE
ncbi:MAG: hypothetical protein WBO10_02360 [Pyrinomonadaceae bacterium]